MIPEGELTLGRVDALSMLSSSRTRPSLLLPRGNGSTHVVGISKAQEKGEHEMASFTEYIRYTYK